MGLRGRQTFVRDDVRRTLRLCGVVLVVVVMSACGGAADPASSTPDPATPAPSLSSTVPPSPAGEAFDLVALGDSIPYNSPDDCYECVGFVTSYGNALEEGLGRPVREHNLSRHDGAQTQDILDELGQSGALVDALPDAEAIVVSIGFNDLPPYAVVVEGCPAPPRESDPATVWAAALAASSEDCIDEGTSATTDQARQVLERIRALAPDAPIGVLTAYDWWSGWTQLDALDPTTREGLHRAIRYALVTWNAALCAEVDAIDGVCIDTYTAFNGPDGDVVSGELLATDYSHPSQEGNDVIRDLLIESDLVPTG